jgi:hypothetical protein
MSNESVKLRYANVLLAAICLAYASILVYRPEFFFVDDCYFYFQIAYNFAHGFGSTFNQMTLANGYHPLWMLICAAVYSSGLERVEGLHAIALVIVGLNLGVIGLIRSTLQRLGVEQWQVSVALLISFLFGTQLGSEGAISALFLSAILYAGVRLTQRFTLPWFIAINVFLDFAVLSRLDNVFICGLVGVACLLFAIKARGFMPMIGPAALAGVLHALILGSYIATNIIYFNAPMPISGMVKTFFNDSHSIGDNVANTGRLCIVICLSCLPFVLSRKPDLFTRYVLTPFGAGVLIHALYIVFVMSSETKWTWYYTSWVLLSSILIGLTIDKICKTPRGNRQIEFFVKNTPFALVVVAGSLALTWAAQVLLWSGKFRPSDAGWVKELEAAVLAENGAKRILAFDFPGKIAFYSDLQVLASDGLTQDLQFQRDISKEGMLNYLTRNKTRIFVGPPLLVNKTEYDAYCARVYLGSTRFDCIDSQNGKTPLHVTFYSRIPFKPVGDLALKKEDVIWASRYTAWKIN